MQEQDPIRKRMQALDGTSFRFERKAHELFVNDMPVQVHARNHGTVELVTEHKTVQVSAATYWSMIFDDVMPTPTSAGMILARYDELVGRLQRTASRERREGVK